jgi:hypothetical protein
MSRTSGIAVFSTDVGATPNKEEESMSSDITAIYKDRVAAANAVDRLVSDGGLSEDDISVLMSDETRGREFEVHKGSKAVEGAAAGATALGAMGAVAASLVAVGTLAVPGIGLVAAGPIIAALAGAGAGGAVGGLAGGLIGLGFTEHEAQIVEKEVNDGGILIGVHAHEDRTDRVRKILEQTGGSQIS